MKSSKQHKLPIISLNVAGGDDLKVLKAMTLMEYTLSLPKEGGGALIIHTNTTSRGNNCLIHYHSIQEFLQENT